MDVFLSSQKSCKVISNEFLIAFFCHNSLCQLYYVVVVGFVFVFLGGVGGGCLQPVGCLFVQSHCSFFLFFILTAVVNSLLRAISLFVPIDLGSVQWNNWRIPRKKNLNLWNLNTFKNIQKKINNAGTNILLCNIDHWYGQGCADVSQNDTLKWWINSNCMSNSTLTIITNSATTYVYLCDLFMTKR